MVHIFPALGTSLLSVGQLCDTQCTNTFSKITVTIPHNGKLLLQGTRNKQTNLWQVALPTAYTLSNTNQHNNNTNTMAMQQTEPSAHNVSQTQKSATLITFEHAS